ncbi:MAG: hypothetical protein ACLQVY_05590, partial [Limisphaerales bacterium]
ATSAGEVRSPELCRVGNHRIVPLSKELEGSKLPTRHRIGSGIIMSMTRKTFIPAAQLRRAAGPTVI